MTLSQEMTEIVQSTAAQWQYIVLSMILLRVVVSDILHLRWGNLTVSLHAAVDGSSTGEVLSQGMQRPPIRTIVAALTKCLYGALQLCCSDTDAQGPPIATKSNSAGDKPLASCLLPPLHAGCPSCHAASQYSRAQQCAQQRTLTGSTG